MKKKSRRSSAAAKGGDSSEEAGGESLADEAARAPTPEAAGAAAKTEPEEVRAAGPKGGAAALQGFVAALAERFAFPAAGKDGAPDLGEEARALVGGEASELVEVLQQLLQKLGALRTASGMALETYVPSDTPMAEGSNASYVEMKVQVLLSYLIYLVYYLLLKVRGIPVDNHPVIPRLIWVRALLEKLRPVDQRLQYQMSKLLQWAQQNPLEQGAVDDARGLRPGELAKTVEDEADQHEEEPEPEQKGRDARLYKPPKFSEAEYTGDHLTERDKAEKELVRKKNRLERSEFMRSLREEFTNAPAEIKETALSARAEKAERLLNQRRMSEENDYTRIRLNKRDRMDQKNLEQERMRSGGVASLDDATADFRELARGHMREKAGKGKKGRARAGSAMEEYKDAVGRAKKAREATFSAMSGRPNIHQKRKGSGKSGGGGAKKKRI